MNSYIQPIIKIDVKTFVAQNCLIDCKFHLMSQQRDDIFTHIINLYIHPYPREVSLLLVSKEHNIFRRQALLYKRLGL